MDFVTKYLWQIDHWRSMEECVWSVSVSWHKGWANTVRTGGLKQQYKVNSREQTVISEPQGFKVTFKSGCLRGIHCHNIICCQLESLSFALLVIIFLQWKCATRIDTYSETICLCSLSCYLILLPWSRRLITNSSDTFDCFFITKHRSKTYV
jgi:hypothetical protein